LASVERITFEVKVEDAVERMPLVNPIVVLVALPYAVAVNGNAPVTADASDEEETLLLNVVQSAEESAPL